MKSILTWIETLLISLAAFVILFLVASVLMPKFDYSMIIILSGSMEPTIGTGSVLISKKQADYSEGDVITFRKMEDEIITHRIIKRLEDGTTFKTKGDANEDEDIFVTQKNSIIGRAMFTIPYFGYLINFSKTKLGIILIFILPATYLITEEIIKIKRELKRKSDEAKQPIKQDNEKK